MPGAGSGWQFFSFAVMVTFSKHVWPRDYLPTVGIDVAYMLIILYDYWKRKRRPAHLKIPLRDFSIFYFVIIRYVYLLYIISLPLKYKMVDYSSLRNRLGLSIYLSIGINVRFAAMMADVGDGLL